MYQHFDPVLNLDTTSLQLPLFVPDPTAYEVFSDFLLPCIEQHHKYKISDKYDKQ